MLNLQRRKLYDTAQVNFSRASAAYNQSGLKIPNNIPRYEWGRWQNLLTKNQSDAEVDTAGWVNALSNISYNVTSIARDTTEKSEGSASIKAVTSGTRTEGAGVITANVVPGKTYISSMKVKGPAGANMKFDAAYSYATGSKTGTAVEFVATGGWQRIFHIITIDPAHIGITSFRFGAYSIEAITYYMDEAQLEEALPGQTLPSPWRPGGTGKAIMIEEGTTNLVPLANQKFEGWSAYDNAVITVAQNQAVPEWGATDATRIQSSGGGGTTTNKFYFSQGVLTSNDTRTFSLYIQNKGSNTVSVKMVLGNTVTLAPGEIKRVSSTTTGNGTQNIQARIESDIPTNGFDVIVWRPQIEAKPYATSWTDGTRQAELCNTSCDGVAESQAGTVEFWAYISDQFKSTPTGPLFSIRTKDNSNYILALRSFNTNQLQLVTRNDSGSITQTGTCSMPLVGWHAFAIKYTKGGNIACFIDGVQQINFASNMESSFGKCYVGGNGATAGNISIDNLRISNIARTDAEIAAAYNANAPLTADQYTTALLDFDDSLEIKNGLIIPDRFRTARTIVM